MNGEAINSRGKIKITQESAFALLIAVFFCHHTLFEYVEIVIGRLPYISMARYFFFPVLYFFLILFSFKRNRARYIRISDFFIILFFTISILLTIIVYPNNAPFIASSLTSHILPCIPFFLLGLCFFANERTINTVSIFSCFAVAVSVVYVFYFLNTGRNLGGEDGGYSMDWSYLLLPNTMIVIDYAFRKKKILAIVCSIIGVMYAFAMGTRGPIVILFFFIAVLMWTNSNLKTGKKILFFLVSAIALIMFFLSSAYMDVLASLRIFLIENRVSTRVVDYLISGEMLSNTDGRTEITQDLMQKLWEHPIVGYGVYGEWPFGYYSAHNMYVEALFHFGIFVGSFLIIAYIALFIKALKVSNNVLAKRWLIMFGCFVFVKGIFGGRYMEYSVFFLLGLCLREIRCAKDEKRQIRRIER
ncbi:O-antigen ligase family protein [Neobacillus drentensis]|uniref:O-antigen ligase family protein n=1 Tax=Neobacillus drentensis TaxID=220684 RepID=UPI003000A9CB